MRTDPDEQRIKEAWKEFMVRRRSIVVPSRGAREIGAIGPLSWDLICKAVRAQDHRREEFNRETRRLIQDKESFEWPLEDPLGCLAIRFVSLTLEKVAFEKLGLNIYDDDEEDGSVVYDLSASFTAFKTSIALGKVSTI